MIDFSFILLMKYSCICTNIIYIMKRNSLIKNKRINEIKKYNVTKCVSKCKDLLN